MLVIRVQTKLPGFMVMKIPHDQTRLISRPSNTNRVAPADRAERMDRICWATTDNTSMLIRLNSSKQPHAPVCKVKYYKENIKNSSVEYFTNLLLQTTFIYDNTEHQTRRL